MIPRISAADLFDPKSTGHDSACAGLKSAIFDIGFLTLYDTPIHADEVTSLIDSYREFFSLPQIEKAPLDMTRTGANRGWGGPGSEQVDPDANPDYKQVFDCGYELNDDDPLKEMGPDLYAPNLWPASAPEFKTSVENYLPRACDVAMQLLTAIAGVIGQPKDYFAQRFDRPMVLLRGNYYPPRPDWAGRKDFGIAAHTDYGCLTLLATDGVPGLEVLTRNDEWVKVTAKPGEFIINFGEMLQIWTNGAVRATLHRVVGGPEERISIPLFFNPNYDTNVAPIGSGESVIAGEYLSKRFKETYVHLKETQTA